MSEHYHLSRNRRYNTIRRLQWLAFGLLITLPVLVIVLFFTTSIFVQREPVPVVSNVQTSVITPSIEVYRSAFFQFQAAKSWSAIANESTATKFVYRKFNNRLIEGQLDIYVNEAADANINATRVLPVIFTENEQGLTAKNVSEPCAKTGHKDRGYKQMKLEDVNFRCNTDATDYSLLIGREGAGTLLDMSRPDGSRATYVIHYRDLRAISEPSDIREIVGTFQTR